MAEPLQKYLSGEKDDQGRPFTHEEKDELLDAFPTVAAALFANATGHEPSRLTKYRAKRKRVAPKMSSLKKNRAKKDKSAELVKQSLEQQHFVAWRLPSNGSTSESIQQISVRFYNNLNSKPFTIIKNDTETTTHLSGDEAMKATSVIFSTMLGKLPERIGSIRD